MKALSKEHTEKLAKLNTVLTELFSGFQVLRSFGAMGHAREEFNRCSTELKQSEQKYDGMDTFSDAFAQFLSVLAQTLIMVLSAWMVMKGRMSAGALVAFTSLNGTFCSALSVVLMGIPMIRGAKPIIERVNGLADYEPVQNGNAAPSFSESLDVKHLSFGIGKTVSGKAGLEADNDLHSHQTAWRARCSEAGGWHRYIPDFQRGSGKGRD